MRLFVAICFVVWAAAVLYSTCREPAVAHPGGLDSQGGHIDRSTGTYHYHRSVVIPAPPSVPPPWPPAVARFDACRSGPAVPLRAGCEWYDLDEDADVDLDDFGGLQRGATWAGQVRALAEEVARLRIEAAWIWPRHSRRLRMLGVDVGVHVDPSATADQAERVFQAIDSLPEE